jgi:hypothetical protein
MPPKTFDTSHSLSSSIGWMNLVELTGEAAALGAVSESNTGRVAVASQMNLYRCDHRTRDQRTASLVVERRWIEVRIAGVNRWTARQQRVR